MAFARDYSVGIEHKVKKDEESTWQRLPALEDPLMGPELNPFITTRSRSGATKERPF